MADFLADTVLRGAGVDDAGLAALNSAIAEFDRALANLNTLVLPHVMNASRDLSIVIGQIKAREL